MKPLLILTVTTLATLAIAGDKQPQPQSQVAETVQEVMLLRMTLNDFYAAPTIEEAREIRSRWQNLPAEVRNQIDRRHLGTEIRILNLESEVPAAAPLAPPKTNTVTEVDAPAVPAINEDVWAQPAPAAATARRPVIYRDELDIFGDRPRAARPRPTRKSPSLQLAPAPDAE